MIMYNISTICTYWHRQKCSNYSRFCELINGILSRHKAHTYSTPRIYTKFKLIRQQQHSTTLKQKQPLVIYTDSERIEYYKGARCCTYVLTNIYIYTTVQCTHLKVDSGWQCAVRLLTVVYVQREERQIDCIILMGKATACRYLPKFQVIRFNIVACFLILNAKRCCKVDSTLQRQIRLYVFNYVRLPLSA